MTHARGAHGHRRAGRRPTLFRRHVRAAAHARGLAPPGARRARRRRPAPGQGGRARDYAGGREWARPGAPAHAPHLPSPPPQLAKALTAASKSALPGTPKRDRASSVRRWVAAALAGGRLEEGGGGGGVRYVKKKTKSRGGAGGSARAPPATPARARAADARPSPPSPPQAQPQQAPPRPQARSLPQPTPAAAAAAAATATAALDPASRPRWRADAARPDVKKGRFSDEEKTTLLAAVAAYAAAKGLDTADPGWLFETRTGAAKDASRGAWQSIAAALPRRTAKSVYAAGTRMLHGGNYRGAWSADDTARLLALVAARGTVWTSVGAALGRLPEACRDRWREARLGDAKAAGRWSDAEAAALDAAVRAHLRARAGAAAPAEPGALPPAGSSGASAARAPLDGVDWSAVSASVATRSPAQCMEKWYDQVSPSMAARGEWGAGDDRRLLRALIAAGPAAIEADIDWDAAVRGRTGAAARRRWRLMLKAAPRGTPDAPGAAAAALAALHAPALLERAAREGE